MEVLKITVLGVIGAILVITLQQQKKEIALLLAIAVGICMLMESSRGLSQLLSGLQELAGKAGLSGRQMKLLFKLLLSSYVIEFGSEICKDAGQQALAAKIQLGGRLIMATMALPVFTSLIELIAELLG
ncbi:MAG: hypothetical protein HFE64_09790 [Lachnospiraceae bacterium]|jgi:stage III sporulation protein AD|nr:hypothetical protein [Lachnospiraceae bacterium]